MHRRVRARPRKDSSATADRMISRACPPGHRGPIDDRDHQAPWREDAAWGGSLSAVKTRLSRSTWLAYAEVRLSHLGAIRPGASSFLSVHRRACRFRHSSQEVPKTGVIADNPRASARRSRIGCASNSPANRYVSALTLGGASLFCKQEVTGSIPVGSTILTKVEPARSRKGPGRRRSESEPIEYLASSKPC